MESLIPIIFYILCYLIVGNIGFLYINHRINKDSRLQQYYSELWNTYSNYWLCFIMVAWLPLLVIDVIVLLLFAKK